MTLVAASDVPAFIAANYDTDSITAALSWASSSVEAYCERRFAQVLSDTVIVDPYWPGRTALLPNPPVTAVDSVQAWIPQNGAMTWVTLANYQWQPDGLIWDITGELGIGQTWQGASWPNLRQSLKVTYDHGYITSGNNANLPQPIIDAVIKAASAYLANPYNLTERKAGDVTYRWSEREKTTMLDDSLLGAFRLVSL